MVRQRCPLYRFVVVVVVVVVIVVVVVVVVIFVDRYKKINYFLTQGKRDQQPQNIPYFCNMFISARR